MRCPKSVNIFENTNKPSWIKFSEKPIILVGQTDLEFRMLIFFSKMLIVNSSQNMPNFGFKLQALLKSIYKYLTSTTSIKFVGCIT